VRSNGPYFRMLPQGLPVIDVRTPALILLLLLSLLLAGYCTFRLMGGKSLRRIIRERRRRHRKLKGRHGELDGQDR